MRFYYYAGIRYNQNGQAVYEENPSGTKLVEEIENIIAQVKLQPEIVPATSKGADTTEPKEIPIKQSTTKTTRDIKISFGKNDITISYKNEKGEKKQIEGNIKGLKELINKKYMFKMEIGDSELSKEKVLNEIKDKYKIEKNDRKFVFKDSEEIVERLLKGIKTDLVLGTLNILGEANNPIEFEPFDKVESKISNKLEKSFKGITFEDIKKNLTDLDLETLTKLDSYFLTTTKKVGAESATESATEKNTLLNITNYFKKKVIDYKTKINMEKKKEKAAEEEKAAEDPKVVVNEKDILKQKLCDLFIKKIINLGEDNKWEPEEGRADGRLNPLVFALNEFNGIYQKDYFKTETTTEEPATLGEPATVKKSDEYKIALINAYLEKLEKIEAGKKNSYLDLFFWDLFCFEFLKNNYKNYVKMCKKSYLFKNNGDVEKKEDLFNKLLAPLDKFKEKENVIIGCQELPRNIDDINKIIGENFTIKKHDKSTGFIMSNGIEFENITEKAIGIFGDFQTQNKDIYTNNKKLFDTTKDKMFVGKFELNNKKEVIVANFHCKSFKENSKVQGELIKYILDELKNIDKKKKFEVFVVGDMNIEPQKKYDNEDKFNKEYKGKGKDKKLISEGKLPEQNENLNKFNKELTGYTIFPEIENDIGTITTLKQRTLFQGQPDKAKHLVATQKDVVILPSTYEGVKLTFGGRENEVGDGDIMKLLQPSKEWPGDHYAIFTEFTLE